MTIRSTIVDLMLELARLDDRQELLGRFVELAIDQVKADRVSVVIQDADQPDRATVIAEAGLSGPPRGATISLTGTAIGAAMSDGRVTSWITESRSEQDAIAMRRLGVQHVLSAPIAAGHGYHGSLLAAYLSDRPDDEASTWSDLAQILASQLDRVHSDETLQLEIATRERRTAKLGALQGLESRLSRTTTIHEVLIELASSFFELVHAERISYARRGPEPDTSTVWAIHGANEISEAVTIPLDEAEFDRTWTRQSHVYNPDHRSSSSEVHRALLESGIVASLNLGVYVDGHPIGTLNVGCASLDPFTTEDQALLTTLASFMGSTLERIEAHDRLVYQAHHDVLTGLVRRDRFEQQLEEEITRLRDSDETSAVCFVDLDRFKLVNDTEGHHIGDRLLRRVADALLAATGPEDLVGRLGGDEFVVLLRHRDRSEYADVCERLADTVSDTGFVAGHSMVTSTASAGWSLLDGTTPSAQAVLAEADAACYVAKGRGGGRATQASDSDQAQAERRNAGRVVGLIRDGLEQNQFLLLAQPIRRLNRSGAEGFEVLVRLRQDGGLLLPPDRFIPAAERYGLIADIDRWVCNTILAELTRARRQERLESGQTVFVNISANSIAVDSFVDELTELLTKHADEAPSLCFEITESGTMRNMEATVDFIQRVKRHGALIALDDFGVGLSSLGALQQLAIDHLKLDGSLVRQIDSNSISVATVTAVRTLTEAMGVGTIAEHIESAAALEVITSLGIDSAQGYFLGHPAPVERVLGIGPRTDWTSRRERLRER